MLRAIGKKYQETALIKLIAVGLVLYWLWQLRIQCRLWLF